MIKPLKPTIENTISKRGGPSSTTLKLRHRGDIGQLNNVNSKFNITLRNRLMGLEKWDFSTSMSKKLAEIKLGMTVRANSKQEYSCKFTQSKKFWECWK